MRTQQVLEVDGHRLACTFWTVDAPRAVVYFHHGLGEHCVRSDHVFTQFNAAGIEVRAYDARGHGQTLQLNGTAGHVGGWAVFRGDLQRFMAAFPAEQPAFLMGHSMGGLVALNWAVEQGGAAALRGIIASGMRPRPVPV